MSRLVTLLSGVAIGGALAHFLDPQNGRRRRDEASTKARHAAGKAKGAAATVKPSGDRIEDVDDVTLARKVESEIFRPADAPKGDVAVDVQDGVVHLRGEVADEGWIARLADEADKVDGVKGVRNLLHRPGTPAPS